MSPLTRGAVTARKRKSVTPKRVLKELVPKDSPWTESDWWNERSGMCRQIVEAICRCLESAVEVLVEEDLGLQTQAHSFIPSESVLDVDPVVDGEYVEESTDLELSLKTQPDSSFPVLDVSPVVDEVIAEESPLTDIIVFDRGLVKCVQVEQTKLWAVIHPNWGKLLSSSKQNLWTVTEPDSSTDPKLVKHAILKPSGLNSTDMMDCVATFKYLGEDTDISFPTQAAAHHLKIAELQFLLLRARNAAKARKGEILKSLRVEMPDSKYVDLGPILGVIADDENGDLFVDDATEILDALIGYCAVVRGEVPKDWSIEHETCGNLAMLFEGWEASNRSTAESFISLCLTQTEACAGAETTETLLTDEPSPKTAVREWESPTVRVSPSPNKTTRSTRTKIAGKAYSLPRTGKKVKFV